MRIVLDSNVYISALLFGGVPELPIRLAVAGKITLFTSDTILAEVSGVLSSKFRWTSERVSDFRKEIQPVAEEIPVTSHLSLIVDDADNRVLECAVDGQADMIVSGDRHLLELGCCNGIPIVSPREFAIRVTKG